MVTCDDGSLAICWRSQQLCVVICADKGKKEKAAENAARQQQSASQPQAPRGPLAVAATPPKSKAASPMSPRKLTKAVSPRNVGFQVCLVPIAV